MTDAPITILPSCDDDFDSASLSCDEAMANILQHVQAITGFEKVHLRAALDRVLAQPVVSRISVPAHTNSAMDGYALNGRDLPASGTKTLTVAGASFAGKPFNGTVESGHCVRIMTGAVLPDGTDTVILQEHVEVDGNRIRIDSRHQPRQNIRAAGEDIRSGETVLPAGQLMTPADLGLVASLGIGELAVLRRPRVAFFSTGDELRSIGEPLARGDVYDSNRYTLFGMLTRLGVDFIDMGVVCDEREALRAAFVQAAENADAVITSGGVSVGEADYTKEILAELGQVRFWKVAMKPGRPLAFGRLGKALFFGLPGNPVSVMVTFYQFVQPALRKLMGSRPRNLVPTQARAATVLKKRPGRVEYQRGTLSLNEAGELLVTPTGDQGSGILTSMSIADCFIVLPMECGKVEAGALVQIQPFFGLV